MSGFLRTSFPTIPCLHVNARLIQTFPGRVDPTTKASQRSSCQVHWDGDNSYISCAFPGETNVSSIISNQPIFSSDTSHTRPLSFDILPGNDFETLLSFTTDHIHRSPRLLKKDVIEKLVALARSKQHLETVANVFSAWRDCELDIQPKSYDKFIARCINFGCPGLALAVLRDKSKYGIDALSLARARQLLNEFSQALVAQTNPAETLQNALTLAALYPRYGLPPASQDIISSTILAALFVRQLATSQKIEVEAKTGLRNILVSLEAAAGDWDRLDETGPPKALAWLRRDSIIIADAIRRKGSTVPLWLSRLETKYTYEPRHKRTKMFDVQRVSVLEALNKSDTPEISLGAGPMIRIAELTQTQEQLAKVVELIAAWRTAGYLHAFAFCDIFVGRCIQLGSPEVALQVLRDRSQYGMDIPSLESARRLLNAFVNRRTCQDSLPRAIRDGYAFAHMYPLYGLPLFSTDVISTAILAGAIARVASRSSKVLVGSQKTAQISFSGGQLWNLLAELKTAAENWDGVDAASPEKAMQWLQRDIVSIIRVVPRKADIGWLQQLQRLQQSELLRIRTKKFEAMRVSSLRLIDRPGALKHSAIGAILPLTQTKQQLEKVLELIGAWHKAGFTHSPTFCDEFIARCVRLDLPEFAHQVLQDQQQYGIQALSLSSARYVLYSLAQQHKDHALTPRDACALAKLYPLYGLPPLLKDFVSCTILAVILARQLSRSEYERCPDEEIAMVETAFWEAVLELKATLESWSHEIPSTQQKPLKWWRLNINRVVKAVQLREGVAPPWLQRFSEEFQAHGRHLDTCRRSMSGLRLT